LRIATKHAILKMPQTTSQGGPK